MAGNLCCKDNTVVTEDKHYQCPLCYTCIIVKSVLAPTAKSEVANLVLNCKPLIVLLIKAKKLCNLQLAAPTLVDNTSAIYNKRNRKYLMCDYADIVTKSKQKLNKVHYYSKQHIVAHHKKIQSTYSMANMRHNVNNFYTLKN